MYQRGGDVVIGDDITFISTFGFYNGAGSIRSQGSETNTITTTGAGGFYNEEDINRNVTMAFNTASGGALSGGGTWGSLHYISAFTHTLGEATTVNGDITIDPGATFDVTATNHALNISGDWTNNGTFNDRAGTVTFEGTMQTISGTTEF